MSGSVSDVQEQRLTGIVAPDNGLAFPRQQLGSVCVVCFERYIHVPSEIVTSRVL